jgi:zinc/manganese transport system permease protein
MGAIDLTIIAPAFVAGLLILMTHVPLGQEVVKRGIIFIDLAIAQIAGAGVIFASWLGFEAHGVEVQLVAIGSSLIGAWGLSLLEKRLLHIQEAVIGVVFVLAATASILLLSDNPHGGQHLKDLLVGQILWITWPQLLPVAVVTVIIVLVWSCFSVVRKTLFYYLFAIAITCSVQLVGVYLVFASLIIPALACRDLAMDKTLKVAFIIGMLGYGLGLLLSSILDLPSGAVIVWVMAGMALLVRRLFLERYLKT